MTINLPDLRFIRKTPGEIAVLRELVSFQRCKVINPSEFRIALMTNYEERQVRRILGKLRGGGLISYAKYPRDFRGPNRPTNTYTLHFDRIQRLIDAGKVMVGKALGTYYDQRGIPKHDKKTPVRMSGIPTGQDVPQDVSLSRENELPYSEYNSRVTDSDESHNEDWEGLQRSENGESSKSLPGSSLTERNVTITTPSPHSAAPPSPKLPEAAPEFLKIDYSIFKKPGPGESSMILHRGKLPRGAIVVHESAVL